MVNMNDESCVRCGRDSMSQHRHILYAPVTQIQMEQPYYSDNHTKKENYIYGRCFQREKYDLMKVYKQILSK